MSFSFRVGSFDDDTFSSSSSSISSKKFPPKEIENRGTYSEKIGKIVVLVLSNSCNLISSGCKALNNWVLTPICDYALSPLLNAICDIFDASFTGLRNVEAFLKTWISEPIMNNVLPPLSEIVSNVFQSISPSFAALRNALTESVFTPISTNLLPPLQNVISQLFDFTKEGLVSFGNTLNEWVFTPISTELLPPMHRAISSLFSSFKANMASGCSILNEHLFSPIYDNALKPALEVINPFVNSSLTTLNDWTFKPLFNGLGDLIHGIYVGVSVDECKIDELQDNINRFCSTFDIQIEGLDPKNCAEKLLEVPKPELDSPNKGIYYLGRNSALALYLIKEHSIAIDKMKVNEASDNYDLDKLFKKKAGQL